MRVETNVEGWIHHRDAMVDDKKVSWLRVQDYTMRIGSAQVRMGGIANVGTDPGERMKGYSRALIEDSFNYMNDQGFDVTMLFGIRNFYHKFGYAVCMPFIKHTMTTRDAEAAGEDNPNYQIREYSEQQSDALLDLYDLCNRERTCTLIRPRDRFTGIRKGSTWGRRASTIVVEDERGAFAGYAAYDQADEEVVITEVQTVSPAVFPVLIRQFAQMAIDRRCSELTFHTPLDHLFTEFLRRSQCRTTLEHPRSGGCMLKIINQDTLFEKLVGELGHRISLSELRSVEVKFNLRTELGDTLLDIGGSQIKAIPGKKSRVCLQLPQSKLIQLICGYRSARSILAESDVIAKGDVLPIVESLFPPDCPYVWVADYF